MMTKKAVEEIKFNNAYIFKYSPRPPAKSAELKDDVPLEVKEKRHAELLGLQKKISSAKK
jgi:tRNA-2-methylthio-N6-dimethylallyladenosine synthase